MSFPVVALRLAPILYHIVATGKVAADQHITAPLPPRSSLAERSVRLLSNWTLDRLAPALQAAGWERVQRLESSDRWCHPSAPTWSVVIENVAGGGSGADAWLEYATLLTTVLPLGEGATLRLSSPVATLALLIAEWQRSGESALDSVPLEDALLLIAGRAELDRELAAAPAELRGFVRGALRTLADCPGLECVMTSAVTGARQQPLLAHRALERLRVLATVPAHGT
jgi:hypothetical protein